jgi:arsenate reductase
MMPDRRVLFICVENACRSLMAEAMFNSHPPEGWTAISAGTRPAHAPNPRTAPMLAEIGVEPPHHPPREITTELMESATIRVSMGCLEDASCPARLKSLPVRDWGLADPAKLDEDGFRAVRDDLRHRVDALVREIAWSGRPGAAAPGGRPA